MGDNTKSNISIDDLDNKDKTIAQIRQESIEEDQKIELTKSNEKIAGYSPTKAKEYAHKWADSYNSAYNKYSKDCTNFVSQCLEAGGLAEKNLHQYLLGQWKQLAIGIVINLRYQHLG